MIIFKAQERSLDPSLLSFENDSFVSYVFISGFIEDQDTFIGILVKTFNDYFKLFFNYQLKC